MADFFSGLAEGFKTGNDMSLQARQQKNLEDQQAFTQKMQQKQMELQLRDQDIQTTGVLFKAFDANIPPAARSFLLSGLASKLGVDPKSEYFKGFSKVIGSMETDQLSNLTEGIKGLIPDAQPGEVAQLVKAVLSGKVTFEKAIDLFNEGKKRAYARQQYGDGPAPGTGDPGATGAAPDTSGSPQSVMVKPKGQSEAGNVPLNNRVPYHNPDTGAIETVKSKSFNIDGKEVLLPTISPDGKPWTDAEAIDNFKKTGQHLGKFDTPENATAYAQNLHQEQAKMYAGGEVKTGVPYVSPPGKTADDWRRIAVNFQTRGDKENADFALKMAQQVTEASKPANGGRIEPVVKAVVNGKSVFVKQSDAVARGLAPANDTAETLHSVIGKDGKPVLLPTSQAAGMEPLQQPKPYADPTETQLAAADVKAFENILPKGMQAQDTMRNTSIIKAGLDSGTFETGTFGGIALTIGKIAQSIGLDPEKDLGLNLGRPATAEMIQSAAQKLATAKAADLSKSTNLSLDLLQGAFPQLVKTVEGNKFIVDAINSSAQTDIKIADKYTENRKLYGKDYAFPPGKPALWEDIKRIEDDASDPVKWQQRFDTAVNKGKEIDLSKLAPGGGPAKPPIIVGMDKGKTSKSYENLGQDKFNHDLIEAPLPGNGKLTKMPVIWDYKDATNTLSTGDYYMLGATGDIYRMTVPGKSGAK